MLSGSEWVLKLGPIERSNSAGSREQAEAGAKQMLLEDANSLMGSARAMGELLLKGVVAETGQGDPYIDEELPEANLVSYQLPNGSWFTLARSNFFGLKVSCGK